MDNYFFEQMQNWFMSGSNMPLVLRGPRGVGKTFTAVSFAQNCQSPYLYVNFENNAVARSVFENQSKSVEQAVCEYFGIEPDAVGRFLIIFDEYKACAVDIESLFSKGPVSLNKVILITSLSTDSDYSNCVQVMIRPLGFRDFLKFIGKDWYSDVILGHFEKQRAVPEMVHQEILDLFDDYLRVGGMPAVIRTYMTSEFEHDILDAQMNCVKLIENDFEKYAGKNSVGLKQIFETVPVHIAANKPHFMPGTIRRGLTLSNVSREIEILLDNGIINKIVRLDDQEEFRLNMTDCGLLNAMIRSGSLVLEDKLGNELTTAVLMKELTARMNPSYVRTRGTSVSEYRFRDLQGRQLSLRNEYMHSRRTADKLSDDISSKIKISNENLCIRNSEINLPVYMCEML